MKICFHLRSTVKRERIACMFIFQTVTIGPMKIFRLEHEIMNICFIVASISATFLETS